MRVIHPLLLLEGKAAALRGLPQADRQDAKHLRMLVLIVRQWLCEQLADPRKAFRAVERLAACTISPDGLQAFAQGIDLAQALPLDDMRAAAGFTAFFEQRAATGGEDHTEARATSAGVARTASLTSLDVLGTAEGLSERSVDLLDRTEGWPDRSS